MRVLQLGLSVCLSVCLSVRSHISKTNGRISLKMSHNMRYTHGSVLLKDDLDLDPDPDLMAYFPISSILALA